jgi:hypothetical protein
MIWRGYMRSLNPNTGKKNFHNLIPFIKKFNFKIIFLLNKDGFGN